MKTNAYLKVLPIVAAMLFTEACNNQDLVIFDELQPETRIIPYTATAGSGISTRVSLNDANKYVFQDGDKLFVWGDNIKGELTLDSGADSYKATFSGDLIWSGEGNPDSDLYLNAVIVGPNSKIYDDIDNVISRVKTLGEQAPDYSLATTFASSKEEAVESFGYFLGGTYYGPASFEFSTQLSAFLSFDITLEDGTAAGSSIDVTVSNGNDVRTGSVTTVKETVNEKDVIKAKFITAFSDGYYYQLSNPTVTLGTRDAISFGGTTKLNSNIFYNVSKTYTRYKITASSGTKSEESSNKPMGYTTTLTTILTSLGYSSLVFVVPYCTCERTDGTSVKVSPILENEKIKDYEFTVEGEGDSIFLMGGTNPMDPTEPISKYVTINVSKMTPPTE